MKNDWIKCHESVHKDIFEKAIKQYKEMPWYQFVLCFLENTFGVRREIIVGIAGGALSTTIPAFKEMIV